MKEIFGFHVSEKYIKEKYPPTKIFQFINMFGKISQSWQFQGNGTKGFQIIFFSPKFPENLMEISSEKMKLSTSIFFLVGKQNEITLSLFLYNLFEKEKSTYQKLNSILKILSTNKISHKIFANKCEEEKKIRMMIGSSLCKS